METQGRLGPELRECGMADWGNRADPSQTARMTLRMIPLTDEQLRVLVWWRVKEKLTTKHEHKAIDYDLYSFIAQQPASLKSTSYSYSSRAMAWSHKSRIAAPWFWHRGDAPTCKCLDFPVSALAAALRLAQRGGAGN